MSNLFSSVHSLFMHHTLQRATQPEKNRLFESIQQPVHGDKMTSLISKNTVDALNPSYQDQFGGAVNKALLDQVNQLKAELQRAQEDIVSLQTHNKELSQTTARQEAKIKELSENAANQHIETQELAFYLRSEEGQNKTLWEQIIYLTRELQNCKKSTSDWKDLYHRERGLHADNKKEKLDLEIQLNARNEELREELNIRREMTANEMRLKTKFNQLREKCYGLAENLETLRRKQEQQQPQNEMWSLQQTVSEQTELIKSLLAEKHHMSNTIMLMTKAAAETERSFQQEIEELKHERGPQRFPDEDDDGVQTDVVHLTEHIEYLNQELGEMQLWAEEQGDLLDKQKALYHSERRRRRQLEEQLEEARKRLQNEPKLDTPNKLETSSHESIIPQNSFTETHPDKAPTSGCKQEEQTKTAKKRHKKRRRKMNKEPSK